MPEPTKTVTGYDIVWGDEKIIAHIYRLHTHHDGRITGDIKLILGAKKHEEPTFNFNFNSARTRKELINSLNEKYPEWKWQPIIDELCRQVQKLIEIGQPVQEMWAGLDDVVVSPPEYLLNPLIVKNMPNVIFGDPGTFKSTIALALAGILLLKDVDNPLHLVPYKQEIASLFLDWENDYETTHWQQIRLRNGLDLPPVVISYRKCSLPLVRDLTQIKKQIEDSKSQLLIVDSVGLACGGELKETQPALDFYAGLRQLEITSLLLAHTKKEDGLVKTMYGNVYFEAQARNIWEIRKVQEAGELDIDIALFNTKPPPFAKKHKPLSYHITFEEDKIMIEQRDATSIPEFVERMGNNQRILNHLKTGAYEPTEIAEALGIKQSSVRVALLRLKAKNLVVKVGEKYGLQAQF